jgi:hypothetical protein
MKKEGRNNPRQCNMGVTFQERYINAELSQKIQKNDSLSPVTVIRLLFALQHLCLVEANQSGCASKRSLDGMRKEKEVVAWRTYCIYRQQYMARALPTRDDLTECG